METVLVFCFYTYDARGHELHSTRAATLEAIERANGVALRETGMEVSIDEVDLRGYLKGPPSCEHPAHRGLQ